TLYAPTLPFFLLLLPPPPISTLFPYTTLFRSLAFLPVSCRSHKVRLQARPYWCLQRNRRECDVPQTISIRQCARGPWPHRLPEPLRSWAVAVVRFLSRSRQGFRASKREVSLPPSPVVPGAAKAGVTTGKRIEQDACRPPRPRVKRR